MASNGMNQLINSVTRGNSSIDHIYFRSRDTIKYKSSVLFPGRSDHSVVVGELEINANRSNSQSTVLETEKQNYKLFKSLVIEIDWSHVFGSNNASEAFISFYICCRQQLKNINILKLRRQNLNCSSLG